MFYFKYFFVVISLNHLKIRTYLLVKNMTNDINSIISINALIRFRGGSLLSSKKLYIITLSDMANSV